MTTNSANHHNHHDEHRPFAWLETQTPFAPHNSSFAPPDEHMENLNLHDAGPSSGSPMPSGPPPVPQLPPQMFTTAAQLLDLTDSES